MSRRTSFVKTLLAGAALLGANPATSQTAAPALPAWPTSPRPAADAPNVLVILTDDVGFAADSTFGGAIPTPTMDRLAARGLRYNRFNTSAICSATRAALLTGRNPTHVGMGGVTNSASSHPGHTTILPKSAATIAEVLKENGYSTAMFGKGHLTPKWETSPAGPFDRWPTGLGFETFYGFLDGDTDQFAPQLYNGTTPVEPPADDPGYILDKDLADHAVQWLRTHRAVAPDKPFFVYYAPGTAHAPQQAPREWIEKFRGQFDQGWDKLRTETLKRQIALGVVPKGTRLSARPPEIPAWDTLDADHRRLYAHMMEVYAAAVAYADDQIGRLIEDLASSGQLDNTLVVMIEGDNGSSAEGGRNGLFNELSGLNEADDEDFPVALAHIDKLGGPDTYGHFPIGWAHAMSTPFPYFKRVASHLGAVRNGMILSWPKRFPGAKGEVRGQYHHVIDVAPTILQATGIAAPTQVGGVAQMPLDGVSMLYSAADPAAPTHRPVQFYELSADAAVYRDGWLANTVPVVMPWQFTGITEVPFAQRQWQLYDLNTDFSQSRDLAARQPGKLAELKALFFSEAARNLATPIERRPPGLPEPSINTGRTRFVYDGPMTRISPYTAPPVINRSFAIEARVVVPQGGADGVLVTQGGRFGGYGLYVAGGKPVFVYNKLGLARTRVEWPAALTPGAHVVRLEFGYDGGGIGKGATARLSVDGGAAVSGRVPSTLRLLFPLSETFDVGADTGTPISEDYRVPFRFTGTLQSVEVQLK